MGEEGRKREEEGGGGRGRRRGGEEERRGGEDGKGNHLEFAKLYSPNPVLHHLTVCELMRMRRSYTGFGKI